MAPLVLKWRHWAVGELAGRLSKLFL